MAIDKIEGFQVVIPNEFLPVLQYLSEGESLDEVIRQSLAVSLFVEKAVSMKRATALSGLSMVNFMSILEKRNISWSEYTEEHSQQDQAFIQKRSAYKSKDKE